MHAPTLHSTYDNAATPHRASAADFLLTHPLLPVLRGVFFSSLLWIFLALAVYGVYALIVAH
ncbi:MULTISPECIES: hypothetical protein [Acidobacteriaceae]|uniref:hypothetical protein n=1 Tax=Acidobacteriaceae TaxID=204434 RepID=UPI00131BEB2A|nr:MULTISPECIES: hypothetical protein [Acidobacteriaceae]MDW5264979.1 hypothetical protein [Edaphobacter sp.]